jgi:tyrosine-protein kinase Etk/Wzc
LRTALQFAIVEAKNNVVVIAGPAPGAGKSFISSNLAAVLAMAGKRVLLVDGDMRKGRLHEYLGLVRGRGLSELIESNAPFGDVLHSNVIDGLDFLSTGALPKNPAELLLNSRLAKLIEAFSKSYDVVVIDSPPVLAVADTGTLASMAGTTFLVARAEATRLGELTESAKRLAQNGVRLNGIVFNGANPRLEQSRFGSKYGGYRYVAYEYGADQDA